MSHDKRRLCIVLCHFYLGVRQLSRAIASLRSRCEPAKLKIVIVSNNVSLLPVIQSQLAGPEVEVVAGDGALMDFSAYLTGLRRLSPDEMLGGVMVVNDTLFTKLHHRWLLRRIVDDGQVGLTLKGPIATGFSGEYQYLLTSNPWSGASIFLCSACLFLNRSAAELLVEEIEYVTSQLPQIDRCRSRSDRDRLLNQLVGDRFFNYLAALVLSESHAAWRPEKHVQVDHSLLTRKALTFYLEHHFSARVELTGGGLLSVNRGARRFAHGTLVRLSLARWRLRRVVVEIMRRVVKSPARDGIAGPH